MTDAQFLFQLNSKYELYTQLKIKTRFVIVCDLCEDSFKYY